MGTVIDLAKIRIKSVYYNSTTAVFKGDPFCYNTDYGTATDEDQSRLNRVEAPSATNSHRFAGTALFDYPNGGVWIKITEPGGYGYAKQAIATAAPSTITPGTRMTFEFTSGYGYFAQEGFPGKGTVEAIRTEAVSTSGALVFSSVYGRGAYAHSTKTITDRGCGSTAGTAAGDTVVVFGGSTNDASATITVGEYTVASVAAGTITLSTSPVSTGDTWYLHYCVIHKASGRPCVLCTSEFDTEGQSGGVEYLSVVDNTACVPTVNGMSILCGGATFGTGPATYTEVAGTRVHQRKGFAVSGTLTTHGLTVTASNMIYYPNSATTATSFELLTNNCVLAYQFGKGAWTITDMSNITIA